MSLASRGSGDVNWKSEVSGELEQIIENLTNHLKTEGFGVLTRIDFHLKVKEKLGEDILPVVILGACNPKLAYETFIANPDVTSLLPCNVVVRAVDDQKYSIEIAKPTAMMKILGDERIELMAQEADQRLLKVLKSVSAGTVALASRSSESVSLPSPSRIV